MRINKNWKKVGGMPIVNSEFTIATFSTLLTLFLTMSNPLLDDERPSS